MSGTSRPEPAQEKRYFARAALTTDESEIAQALRSTAEDINRAWNEGDFERAYSLLGDDFVYTLAATWPQSRPLHGRAEVVAFFKDFRETFPDAHAGPLEFIEVGPQRLILRFPVVGTGRASGVRTEIEIWQVWQLDEGVPVRCDEYPDRAAALRAAGMDG